MMRTFGLAFAGAFGTVLGKWSGRLAAAGVLSIALGFSRARRLAR